MIFLYYQLQPSQGSRLVINGHHNLLEGMYVDHTTQNPKVSRVVD